MFRSDLHSEDDDVRDLAVNLLFFFFVCFSAARCRAAEDSSDDDEPLIKMVKKGPSNEQLKETVQSLLKEANLEEMTMKQICQRVSLPASCVTMVTDAEQCGQVGASPSGCSSCPNMWLEGPEKACPHTHTQCRYSNSDIMLTLTQL